MGAVQNLFKILGIGTLVFLLAAMIQEWEFFSSSWFGSPEIRAVLSEQDRDAALEAVRNTLLLMSHYYGSAGDARFVERIPASERILAEMNDDIAYLQRNHRRQEPTLQRVEALTIEARGTDRAVVNTREFWIHRLFWVIGEGEAEPPRSQIVLGSYRLERDTQGWRVVAWDLVDPPPTNVPTSNESNLEPPI